MHESDDDILRLPAAVPAPPRPVLPLAAAVVPVAGAAALWWLTGSSTALWLAALGPLLALASFLDGLRGSRRMRRRARRAGVDALARLSGEIDARHDAERRRAWRRTPDVAGYAGRPDEIWRVVPGRDEVLVVGRGEVPSTVHVEGEASSAEARALARRARTLADAPVTVPVGAGVAVVGPEIPASAVVRALTLQLCLAQPPGLLRLAGGDTAMPGPALPHAAATGGRALCTGTGDRPLPVDVDIPIVRVAPGAPPPPRCAAVLTLDAADSVDGARLEHGALSRRVRVEAVSAAQADRIAEVLAARAATLGQRVDGTVGIDELPVAEPGGAPSLVAAVGLRSGEPFALDLVADGPHAVVIGVTGSGKSELLTTWIAGMCRGRSPQEVSFLLIDFKGGRTFDALAPLPHVTGVLTDLDEARTVRAVESLRAEVRHRERTLQDAGVRDIDEARGALARLVIVVDEYAALVSAHPGLHELFADIAARGRALGMHLVLASQRAAGAFRDAVLANAPLRIAFRVTDAADSRAVLGRDDAAHLSGAAAARGTALVRRAADDAPGVVRVARCGQSALAGLCAASAGATPARRPWLPPLPERVSVAELSAAAARDVAGPSPHLGGLDRRRRGDPGPPPLVLALVDEPDRQRQSVLVLEPGESGFAVIGGGGSGRSTLLRTVAMQAERSVRVEGDLEEAWDRVTALDDAAAGTVVVVDDADALAARLPADHAAQWIGALERVAREARSRGIVLVLSASRATGPLGRVIDLLPRRAILALPTRADHVAAGGEPGEHRADAPPGRGRWGRRLVQFAVPDAGRADDAPPGTGGGRRGRVHGAPVWHPEAGLPAALVMPDGARADAVCAALAASGVEVVTVASETSASPGAHARAAGGGPRVVVGAPEEWLGQWRMLGAARSRGELVVDAGCAAEYRAVTGRRELPPYVTPGAHRAWALAPDAAPRRVTLPAGPGGTDTAGVASDRGADHADVASAAGDGERKARHGIGGVARRQRPDPHEQRDRDRRGRTAAAVEHLQDHRRAVRGDHDHDALGAELREDAEALDRDRVGASVPFDRPRVLPHGAHERSGLTVQGERRPLRRRADAVHGPAERAQAHRVHGRAAAVDGGDGRTCARQPLDHLADVGLQRVGGIEVARDVPAVDRAGQEHRGVLAGAGHADPARLPELADQLIAGGAVARPVGRAAEVVLAETGLGEDLADHGDVAVGARVARRGEDELLALELGTRGEAAERLQGLEAGAGEDRRLDVAAAQQHHALGVEDDRRAGVPGLDEAAALDDGELDGAVDGDRAGACGRRGGCRGRNCHAQEPTSPPRRLRRRLADWGHDR